MDWKYKNEPDGDTCLAMNDGKCSWHRGKALGGSSAINGMLYVRGDRDDYDQWSQAGNPGWSYEEVLPYFKKSMDQQDPILAQNTKVYGTGGPLVVETPSYRSVVSEALLKAASEAGYKVKDINDGEATGFAQVQMTADEGKRMSSAKAFLNPKVTKRRNLDVVLNAQVTQILIKNSRAYGVVFARFGDKESKYFAYARAEVILSAGAIASPQLLLLSGIGPLIDLNYHGIPVIKNLPGVGKNLQCHVGTGEVIFTVDKPVASNPIRVFANPINLLDYFLNGNGPLR